MSSVPRAQKRLVQLLEKGSTNDPATSTKSWSLDFLLSPECLNWSPVHPYGLSHVKFNRNELDPANPYLPSTKVTPKYLKSGKRAQMDIPASTFFRSVGYKSHPLPGLETDLGVQFDTDRGVIPNDGFGRITSPVNTGDNQRLPDGSLLSHLPGLYCAGWVKRGPTGVIATTMTDAFNTADTIAADLANHDHKPLLNAPGQSTGLGWEGVRAEAQKRGLQTTDWKDWQRIDTVERERGQQKGKIRDKIGRIEEMLQVVS